jgi:hypothetical protein
LTPTGDIFRFERSRTTRFNERTLASFSNPNPPLGQTTIVDKRRVVSINEGFNTGSQESRGGGIGRGGNQITASHGKRTFKVRPEYLLIH